MERLELYIPKVEDMWFFQQMRSDPDTMSYNANWDVDYDGYHRDTGCIDIPKSEWKLYAPKEGDEPERFFAYIQRGSDGVWIGDVSFHYTPEKDWWDMGIVIFAPYRGKGYAVPALRLMLDHAFRNCGVTRIHNDFELARNEVPAWKTHRSAGFKELGVEDGFLQMMITREDYFNAGLERLCGDCGVSVRISTINDHNAPKLQTDEVNGVHVVTLNKAKIPAAEYEIYAGYYTGKILLPRLKLETERLILRRYMPEDAESCFALLSNERDAYMDCTTAFTSMDKEYYERIALFGERETQYMIVLKDNGEVIGTVNVFADNSRAVDAMEIGYCVCPAHQRKGYAFEALSALLHILQNELYLDMVTAGILPENIASEKLLAKLGFHKEGLRHKAVWHEGLDKPVDLIYFYRDRQENAK